MEWRRPVRALSCLLRILLCPGLLRLLRGVAHTPVLPFYRNVLTGSYHNYFRIYDTDTLNDVVLQADKSAFKIKKIGGAAPGQKMGAKNGARPNGLRDMMALDALDFNKKILHASWHPKESTIAVSQFDRLCVHC